MQKYTHIETIILVTVPVCVLHQMYGDPDGLPYWNEHDQQAEENNKGTRASICPVCHLKLLIFDIILSRWKENAISVETTEVVRHRPDDKEEQNGAQYIASHLR